MTNKRWQSESGSNRVNRGGSWNNDARNCRSSNRNNNNPDNSNNNLGLRLALSELRIARMSGYSDMCCKQIAILNAPLRAHSKPAAAQWQPFSNAGLVADAQDRAAKRRHCFEEKA
jgi:hypothetical protein